MRLRQALDLASSLGQPDPHLAAQAVFDSLPRSLRDRLALSAFEFEVRRHFGIERTRAQREQAGTLDCAFPIDGLETRWAYLRDMTRLQVRMLASHYRQREEANAVQARRFEALDRAMARRNAVVVGDLGEALVDGILSGRTQKSAA